MFSRAGFASYETNFVAVHAFERYELGCEVVSMQTFLRSIADPAGQKTEAAAHLAGVTRIRTLEFKQNYFVLVNYHMIHIMGLDTSVACTPQRWPHTTHLANAAKPPARLGIMSNGISGEKWYVNKFIIKKLVSLVVSLHIATFRKKVETRCYLENSGKNGIFLDHYKNRFSILIGQIFSSQNMVEST